jgi:hypothetical protein
LNRHIFSSAGTNQPCNNCRKRYRVRVPSLLEYFLAIFGPLLVLKGAAGGTAAAGGGGCGCLILLLVLVCCGLAQRPFRNDDPGPVRGFNAAPEPLSRLELQKVQVPVVPRGAPEKDLEADRESRERQAEMRRRAEEERQERELRERERKEEEARERLLAKERERLAEEERRKNLEKNGLPYYPPPKTDFKGKNAEEWYQYAKDHANEEDRQRAAMEAMVELKEEAIPFLFNALDKQPSREGVDVIIGLIRPTLVHKNDLPHLVKFLDKKRAYNKTRMVILDYLLLNGNAGPLYDRIKAAVSDLAANPKYQGKVAEILPLLKE